MPSSSSSSDCPDFVYHPYGRAGIGVDQPQAGTDFPLVRPSEDIRYLLADFSLVYDDPSDYANVPAYEPPFRVHWLYGFGCVAPEFEIPAINSSSSADNDSISLSSLMPVPRHAHDIIIVDANDNIVVDTTIGGITYETREWGDRLRIVLWRHPKDWTCAIVVHTAWGPTDTPTPRQYDEYMFPESAILDNIASERLPARVRSIQAVLTNIREKQVELVAGYNVSLFTGDTLELPGGRRTTAITFNANPGDGYGVFPGCDPEPLTIKSINGVLPTTDGDFYLVASDCYWVRQPTRVLSDSPRETLPEILLLPGSVYSNDLPHINAGKSKALPGWPTNDDQRYAHLQIGNDCGACCDCDDYIGVANYMNDVRDSYQQLGESLENTRDTYHENRDRWIAFADCTIQFPIRVKVLPQICPYLDVSVQFCNQTPECQTNVVLLCTIEVSPEGGIAKEVPGYTFISGGSKRGRTTNGTERYQMGGAWPAFSATFEFVQPGQSVSARFRLMFDDCGVSTALGPTTPFAVTVCATGTSNGSPITVPSGDTVVPAEVCASAVLNCPPPPGFVTNLLTCACEKL